MSLNLVQNPFKRYLASYSHKKYYNIINHFYALHQVSNTIHVVQTNLPNITKTYIFRTTMKLSRRLCHINSGASHNIKKHITVTNPRSGAHTINDLIHWYQMVFKKNHVMWSTGIDLYVKVHFIVVLIMYVLVILRRFVWTTWFVQGATVEY